MHPMHGDGILRRINKARLVSNSDPAVWKYGNAEPVSRVVSGFAMRTHRVVFVLTKSDWRSMEV